MSDVWRSRLLAAIEEDERSDRAIGLAAGLGPNFISQMRGTGAAQPKNPSLANVQKLARALGKDLPSIIGSDDTELRSALLAYGVPARHMVRILAMIDGFVEALSEELSEQDAEHDRSARANLPHAKEPFE